jgi:Family of unknown function (DUF6368)
VGISWNVGEEPGQDEDFAAWCEKIAAYFGLQPRSRIFLDLGCNEARDHRILGELAIYFARTLSGVIDFNGALMITPTFEGREGAMEWLSSFEQSNWSEFSKLIGRSQWMGGMPGRILSIPYETANGHTWTNHVCDKDFMAAWLEHPSFHMIK